MSQIRLYVEEDSMDRQLVEALRSHDLDVSVFGEAGTTAITDEQQLTSATEQGQVLYTFNVGDFCRLHGMFMAQKRNHTGIIIGTQHQYLVEQQLQGILKLIATKSAEEMSNALLFLSCYIS